MFNHSIRFHYIMITTEYYICIIKKSVPIICQDTCVLLVIVAIAWVQLVSFFTLNHTYLLTLQ